MAEIFNFPIDDDPPTPEEVAEILEDARGLLLADGWTQHTSRSRAGQRCLVAALSDATSRRISRKGGRFADAAPPLLAVRRQLGLRQPEHLPHWNDLPGRTFDDVVDMLETTAKRVRVGDLDYT